MHIPAMGDCLDMIAGMQMPENIMAHSRLVCRVAVYIADELIAAGCPLNRSLVAAAAMLHDITKPRSLQTKENHAQTGGEYLSAMGFPEVGDIVRQHVVLDEYIDRACPIEAEVVNYADKRVIHDRVASLEDRMTYILNRYAHTTDRRIQLQTVWRQTIELENQLFTYLTFSPAQLAEQLPAEGEGLSSERPGGRR